MVKTKWMAYDSIDPRGCQKQLIGPQQTYRLKERKFIGPWNANNDEEEYYVCGIVWAGTQNLCLCHDCYVKAGIVW